MSDKKPSSTLHTGVTWFALLFLGFALGWSLRPIFQEGPQRHHGPEGRFERHLGLFGEELGLTEEQSEQVKAIMRAKHEELKTLHDSVAPTVHAVEDAAHEEISALLDSDQKERFQALERSRRQRRSGRFHHGPPHDRPHGHRPPFGRGHRGEDRRGFPPPPPPPTGPPEWE